jgi:predicted nucleic acid-binding protein
MKLCAPTAMVAAGDMYLDTGILVKLLAPEPETTFFDRELQGQPLVTSELALVEVKSALYGKERGRTISREQRVRAEAKFREMIEQDVLELRDMNNRVLHKAAQVLQASHPDVPLRSLDALHVATCDLVQEFPLCATDARIRAAAQKMHIPVFPAEWPVKV